MNLTIENILLVGSLLLLLSVVAGKTSYRFGIPTLIFFLSIGMLAGSEGIGGIHFDDPKLAQFIGIVSLNFILFSGGLVTSWETIRPVLWQGIALSSLGVLITALSLGVWVWSLTDFTIYEGLLLGAIVSSTDAAAVFSILRQKSLALKSNLRPTLELESGSNDPMAYVLTIAFLGLVADDQASIWSVVPLFLTQMILGGALGLLFGYASKYLINHIRLGVEGLYPVLTIAIMFVVFSVTDVIGGNGFLAVYLCAVYLGNQDLIHKKTVINMFDGLAWLMQIVLFLTLGLLVFPSQIIPFMGIGLLISLFLILIARPLSVLISLSFFRMKLRRRGYIAWVGLRGAVPIVFATYPMIAGIEKSEMIFNIVFFISVTSVLLQGTTLGIFARWFKVSVPEEQKPMSSMDLFLSEGIKSSMKELKVLKGNIAVGKRIVDLNLPKTTIIAMINRDRKFIVPNGATVIEANDILILLAEDAAELQKAKDCLKG